MRRSQSARAVLAGTAGGELLHPDHRPDGGLDLPREVRLEAVAGELVGDRGHDHALVEREVVARDLAGDDVDRVVEAARAVGVEVAAQLRQVRERLAALEVEREEGRVRRDDAAAVAGRRRRAGPAALEAVVDERPLLVGRVAVRLEPDRVDAVLAVAAVRVVRRREAPVAVAGLLLAVVDLRPRRRAGG